MHDWSAWSSWWVDGSSGLIVNSLSDVSVIEVTFPWEVDDLFDNLNIFFVNPVNVWNPLGVHLILKFLSGWGCILDVLFNVSNLFVSEVFVSLSSSSPFVRDGNWVLEIKMSWCSFRSWSEFGLLNLVVPGRFVHLNDVFSSSLPVLSILFELFLSTIDVLDVISNIFSNLPFESKSIIDILINVLSHLDGGILLLVSDQRLWVHHALVLLLPDIIVVVIASMGELLIFLWPGSFNGLSKGSFVSSNAGLILSVVIDELLLSHGVVS